jgi:Kef-type K+ transport system membrane component KefB
MDILAATMGEEALVVLLVGAIVIVSMSLKALLGKAGLPVMIGYIFIGMAIRGFDSYKPVLDEHGEVFLFLAELGVICLLFRIGLESNLHKLLSKLGKATFIGLFCVAVSGLAAYYACRFILGMDLITSLIVGTAMTATSVGIPAQVWERAGKVGSDEGQLLLDVAELDDIVGVVLMGLLFAMLPRITGSDEQAFAGVLTKTAGIFTIKLVAFGAFCLLFGSFSKSGFAN